MICEPEVVGDDSCVLIGVVGDALVMPCSVTVGLLEDEEPVDCVGFIALRVVPSENEEDVSVLSG